MAEGERDEQAEARSDRSLRHILFGDVHPLDLPDDFRRDLRDLYGFYLDDEARSHLASMGRVRRAFHMVVWILKNLLRKLSPGRRMMLIASVVMYVLGRTGFGLVGLPTVSMNLRLWGFFLLLLVLMLELKDKLLARDEIEVARQVQLALLPQTHPQPTGWGIWSYTHPANDVGGDLVDSLVLPSGEIDLALGDVAGKGLGAALLMAKLQATLRALAPQSDSLAHLGSRANTILYRDGLDNRFATLFYLRLEPGSSRIRYLNAGHNPPFLVGSDGLRPLPASSRPLGMFAHVEYDEETLVLQPGDLLVLYSDGLVEARGPEHEEYGTERLRLQLPALRGLGAEAAGRRLLAEVDRFLGSERPHDDLSLVVVQYRGTNGAHA